MRQFFICLEAVPHFAYIAYLLQRGIVNFMSVMRTHDVILCSPRQILCISCVLREESYVTYIAS